MSLWLQLCALLPGLLLSYAMIRIDKYEREPFAALAGCFVLGALATFPAVAFEKWAFRLLEVFPGDVTATFLLAFGGVSLAEEGLKFTVLLLAAFPWAYFNEPLDGIVYATLVAMGFATAENFMYADRFGMQTVVVRAATAVPAHLVFAIVQGYYFGLAKFNRSQRSALILTGFMLAFLLHGAYDFLILQRWSDWLMVLGTFSLYLSLFYCSRLVRHHLVHSPFYPPKPLGESQATQSAQGGEGG